MGDIPHTLLYRLRRWWWKWETRSLQVFIVVGIAGMIAIPYRAELKAFMAALLVAILGGCASMRFDDYNWRQTLPESAKPWVYVYAADVDAACRALGGQAAKGHRFNGCAQWKPAGCVIVLPQNGPMWIVAHEERHCLGWTH